MSGWGILLIIVTIVGFLISILLSLLFVYFPGQRASNKFDDLVNRGNNVIDSSTKIGENVLVTADLLTEFSLSLCEGVKLPNNGKLSAIINSTGELTDFCESIQ